MLNGNTPDITLAQVIGGLATLLGALAGFVSFSGTWPRVAIIVGAFVVVAAWIVGDAIIRHGRSRALAPTAAVVAPLPPKAAPPA